ncbi:MAG: cell wall hydrolase, partial [Gammaproteobacteria bacterium]
MTQVKYGNIATRYALIARYPRPDGLLTMFNSLLYRARSLSADLRRNLLFYWLTKDTGDLVFFALAGLPIVTLGLLFRFAYTDHIRIASEQQRHADLSCLAGNIYFEARGEPMAGQYAVAEVTLNRVASTRFPSTVCEVVHEKRWDATRERYVGAFSWTELDSVSWPNGIAWERAMMAAVAVYDNQEAPRVPGALFYHAKNISPRWSKTKKQVAEIGKHKFY